MTKKVNGGKTKAENIVKAVKALEAKAETKVRNQDVKTLYDDRQQFIAQHGKAIAAEFAKEGEKASWWFVRIATKLPDTMVGYTLNALGLIKTRNKLVLALVEADKAFSVKVRPLNKLAKQWVQEAVVQCQKAEKGKPKSKALMAREKKEAESVERFKASSLPSEVVCASLK